MAHYKNYIRKYLEGVLYFPYGQLDIPYFSIVQKVLTDTVGIWIPGESRFWMGESGLDTRWSGFWMPFEYLTA